MVFAGDGAMQMNGMAELITIKRYWQRWSDPRLVVAVLHNNDLNQVTWEMRAMGGAPKFAESQTLPDVDYAAFAASIGLASRTVTDPDDLGAAWDEALSADRPTVLDVHTDPDIPPIPPHATFAQAKATAEALHQGRRGPLGRGQGGHQDQGAGAPAPPLELMGGRPPVVEDLRTTVLTVPTDAPESDGTAEWTSTTMVVVRAPQRGRHRSRLDLRAGAPARRWSTACCATSSSVVPSRR